MEELATRHLKLNEDVILTGKLRADKAKEASAWHLCIRSLNLAVDVACLLGLRAALVTLCPALSQVLGVEPVLSEDMVHFLIDATLSHS